MHELQQSRGTTDSELETDRQSELSCTDVMYHSRSSTVSFTYAAYEPRYRPLTRSTEPEVFTFDRVPDQPASPPRQRRRATRIMYPAKVRRYLPPAEKSHAKRLLLALCLLLLAQIYTEHGDEELELPETSKSALALQHPDEQQGVALVPPPPPLYLSFQSAEESARSMTGCTEWNNATHEIQRRPKQSARNNGYVVALLYPVYHTLGTEQ